MPERRTTKDMRVLTGVKWIFFTMGAVSLTLSGRGNGVDLGFAFGRFTITPAGREVEPRRADPPPPPPPPSDEPIRDEDLPASDPPPPGY